MFQFQSLLSTAFFYIISTTLALVLLFTIFFVIIPLKTINSRKKPGVRTCFFPILGYFYHWDKSFKEKDDIFAYSKEHRDQNFSCKFIATHVNKTSMLVLQDTQYIKEFLQNPSHYRKAEMVDSLKPLSHTGLVFTEGETWKRHRKIISSSFNFEFLKTNIDLIQKTAKEFFDKLSPEDYKDYKVIAKIQEITGEAVGRIFFGEHLNSYTFEGKSLTLALADITTELGKIAMMPLFLLLGPKMLNLPIPRCQKVMQRIKKMRQLCLEIIQDRKAKPIANSTDLLSSLLATQKFEDKDKMFSDEDIVNEFITFFIAGMDTTGHLIGMSLYNLTQHPEYLSQLKTERNSTYSNKGQPLTTDTLSKMEVLHAFMKETLRFHTPGPITFVREAIEDHDLLDIKVKKGEFVMPDLLYSAFDAKNFENPTQFNPQRWMNGENKIDPYAFIPFSAGPRNCIGQHLAIMEAKIILSEFLERFDFELRKGYRLRMTFGFLYEPEEEIIFTLRTKV